MHNHAVNAMIPMKAMKKFPNEPMPFINNVPAATRDMAPVRLKRNVPPVMSCKPEKQDACHFFSAAVKFCSITKRVTLC